MLWSSQTYQFWKRSIISLNKFVSTKRPNLIAGNLFSKSYHLNLQLNVVAETNGCIMGGPLSASFNNIYIVKIKNKVVTRIKPIFYRRYVDDIFDRRKKNVEDFLFKRLDKLPSKHRAYH